jgi:FHS family glucose/mannose:H+ symporter-like MFS transporter
LIETSMRGDRVVLTWTATVAVGATFLFMGLVVSAYGPLLEHLTHRFGVSLPVAGSTISVHFAASLFGVFAAMRSMRAWPARRTLMAATALVAAGCVAVAVAPTWPAFVVAVAIVGFGFGALVLGVNQVVAYSEGKRRAALLNALNGAYSAGAVAGPILVAAFATEHFSLLYLAAAALALAIVPGDLRIRGRLPVAAGTPARPGLLVLIFVCAFVLYVAVENGTGGWMTSHLESVGLSSGRAALVTSGFWLALVTGRLLIALVPPRVGEARIVLAASALGTIALAAASIGPLAPFAYVAAGLVIAPIFPTGIVWLARLRPGDSRATSWLYPAASIGGTFGPGVIGVVIAHAGVGWAPAVLALAALGMFVTFFVASRR